MTACAGSTLFALTWKRVRTPSGQWCYLLRASARPMDATGFASWPTPIRADGERANLTNHHGEGNLSLRGAASLSAWPTPRAEERDQQNSRDDYVALSKAAKLAGWPTPTSTLADKGVRSEQGAIIEAMRTKGPDLAAVSALASWATPMHRDWKDSPGRQKVPVNGYLARQVFLAGWPTPMAGSPATDEYNEAGTTDSSRKTVALISGWATPKATDGSGGRTTETVGGGNVHLDRQARLTASGPTPSGSPAGTASGGQLNPAHSRWLQGLPPAWDACAPTATVSRRPSRRRS